MSADEVKQSLRTPLSAVQKAQVGVAALALLIGLAVLVFYGFGKRAPAEGPKPAAAAPMASAHAPTERPGLPAQNPPEVAARAAHDVLAKLKTDPNNFDLLRQAGNIYLRSRVFPGAIEYYEKALAIKDDATVRNDYGNALFYSGQADRALQQYEDILKADRRNVNALFNRGMVRWRAKHDPQGAVQSWKRLLKVSPKDPRRAGIEEMIAQAERHAARPQ